MRLFALLLVCLLVPRAQAQTQTEMNRLACAEADAADAALNVVYSELRDSLDDGRRRALRDVQRAWIAFRDARLAWAFYVPPGSSERMEYGSIYPMERCDMLRALTEERTDELRQNLGNG